jgi:hypothetical protein
MTPILATVLKVDKRGNEYVVTVQLGGEKYWKTFEKLIVYRTINARAETVD